MKRNLALLTLLFVCMASLVLMPVLAQKQGLDPVGPVSDTDKFLRMGKNAIPRHYIIVLDADADVVNGDFARTAQNAGELMTSYGGAISDIYSHAINGFS